MKKFMYGLLVILMLQAVSACGIRGELTLPPENEKGNL